MRLDPLLPLIHQDPGYRELATQLGGETQVPGVRFSVLDAAKAAVIAALHSETARPTMLLVSRLGRARQIVDELRAWSEEDDNVFLFPELDALPYERMLPGIEHLVQRLHAMMALCGVSGAPNPLVVVTARAAMDRLMSPEACKEANWRFKVGDGLQLDRLLGQLVRAGYESVPVVAGPGEFARRGGILDIAPFGARGTAYRMELVGNDIDSLREVDLGTQRSVDLLDSIVIGPAHEVLSELPAGGAAKLDALRLSGVKERIRGEIEAEIALLKEGRAFPLLECYRGILGAASILDYLPDDGLLIVDEPGAVATIAREIHRQAQFLSADLLERGEAPGGLPEPYFSWDDLAGDPMRRHRRRLDLVLDPDALDSAFTPAPSWSGRLPELIRSLAAPDSGHLAIVTQQSARLEELLHEDGIKVSASDAVTAGDGGPPRVSLIHGSLGEGWGNEGVGLTILTDREIFGWAKVPRGVRWRAPVARERFLSELEEGELVVHVDHGIGRYRGLVRLQDSATGTEREYLDIEYADRARLRVAVEHADRVTRYVGSGEAVPALSSLGGGDWQRTKRRVRAAVQRIAKELVELYARRELAEGVAFGPDHQWQMEMEAAFPYVETADQLEAVEEVKRDLERARPMDRLIVGDVGYGKTEVALRAAFKAVTEGKQVAVLVPTTVLAQQHYNTFRERLAPFPVRVEVLSRFLSDAQAREVVQDARDGKVDIVIGTHRLLQPDVGFKDLGLLIIDEEQRFGVAHKERFKELRTEVHVLTMSATPIPRTLHLSLVGVRDLSMIQTAPEDRLPIRTYVAEHEEALVREAILRELDRGGQVYYVSNRVHSIQRVASQLSALVPEGRIGIAHGQMADEELEEAMLAFVNGDVDVLVCTTIIEAGLDLSNVNTIIISDAQRLGLAQLYQLRGRVGRGANRAYAYVLYPPDRQLTEIAEKRLRAIFEASELGAGYAIALKDLEIRGAGNLLGVEQHGQIAAIGFDLYCKLLGEAVQQLRDLRDQALADDGLA
ncbi:MAG: transcription-repair coupling factor, partial [Chloroflexi bacterium]|nr:transcription-repair coupling factor [Chloroflexota bacterium]